MVIGIDGADPALIERWTGEGRLPTFARLMKEGAFGHLKSVHNMRSASAWTSFATGKNPGAHGIFDFWHRIPGSYGIRFVNRLSRSGKALWDYVCQFGGKCIVINVPMTYPADDIDGVMICGMDAPGMDSEGFCHPPQIINEVLTATGGYILEPGVTSLCMAGKFAEALELSLRAVDLRFKAACHLMQSHPWDLLVLVFRETDPIQHTFWKFMDSSHPDHDAELARRWGDAICQVYEQIDSRVGALLDLADEDVRFFLLSDHGFGVNQGGNEHLPAWLEAVGYMQFHDSREGKGFGSLRSVVEPLIVHGASFLVEQVHRRTSRPMKERLTRWFPGLREKVHGQLSLRGVDWSRTRAFADGARENIWVNLKGREPQGIVNPGEEFEKVVTFLQTELMAAKEARSGKPVAKAVVRGSEVYHGPHLEQAADLIVEWNDDVVITGIVSPNSLPHRSRSSRRVSYMPGEEARFISGYHRPFGIFMAGGAGIRSGVRLSGAEIIDIAPTVLHAMGLPVPDDMEGQVLRGLFGAEESAPESLHVAPPTDDAEEESAYSEEDAAQIARRLQGLGYL